MCGFQLITYSSRTPVLADVNNDGKMEIIVTEEKLKLCLYL